MSLSLTTPVSLPPNVLIRKLDDESVLLDLDSEQYYGLDEVGTRMLDALCTGGSVEAASEELVDEYDIEPEVLRDDLRDLAQRLLDRGLLRTSNS